MDPIERQAIAKLKAHTTARIQAATSSPWEARRAVANELLAAAHDAWWSVHATDASAYQRDPTPDPGLASFGQNVGKRVRADGTCPVFCSSACSAVHGGQTTIVRTNFLRTVYGPNSAPELRRLGREILGS